MLHPDFQCDLVTSHLLHKEKKIQLDSVTLKTKYVQQVSLCPRIQCLTQTAAGGRAAVLGFSIKQMAHDKNQMIPSPI